MVSYRHMARFLLLGLSKMSPDTRNPRRQRTPRFRLVCELRLWRGVAGAER